MKKDIYETIWGPVLDYATAVGIAFGLSLLLFWKL